MAISIYIPTNSISSVQSLSHVQLFETPSTAAHQSSLSITNSRVHPNPCPLCQWCQPTISSSVFPFSSCPQSFPGSGSFAMSRLFTSGGQSIGVSPSVLPMNIQGWFSLGLTGLVSLLSKGVKSSPALQFESIKSSMFSLLCGWTLTLIHDCWKNHSLDYTDLCYQSDVSAF